MKAVYITGKGLVSPVGSDFQNLKPLSENPLFLEAEKPDFGKYFDIKQARRTSKILRMAMVAAFDALGENKENVNGVIVGTGIGCISDSEKFLVSLLQFKEEMLSPTSFIQSTHNTIAASIAMQLKLHEYNLTYSERIFSFEWALLDAQMQLNETPENTRFLVGSADELTERTFHIGKALNLFREADNSDIVNTKQNAFVAGEHAAFFTLSNTESPTKLQFVKLFFKRDTSTSSAQEKQAVFAEISEALKNINVQPDCILLGINGQKKYDRVYDEIETIFPESSLAYWKHLSGESFVSSGFAFWLATEILEKNELPETVTIKAKTNDFKNVLILNHFRDDYFSATLLTK